MLLTNKDYEDRPQTTTDTHRHTDTDTDTERERERYRHRHRHRHTDTHTKTQTQTQTHTQLSSKLIFAHAALQPVHRSLQGAVKWLNSNIGRSLSYYISAIILVRQLTYLILTSLSVAHGVSTNYASTNFVNKHGLTDWVEFIIPSAQYQLYETPIYGHGAGYLWLLAQVHDRR